MATFTERARAAGHEVSKAAEHQAQREATAGDLIGCHKCAERWPACLIDGKDDGTGDFTILQCPPCYGPGWSCI